MKVKKENYLLHGPIFKRMAILVIQIAATSILQQLFTSADMAIAGKCISDSALAAIGCTSPLIGLFIEFFLGLSNSSNVIISRFIGAADNKSASRAIDTSIAVALASGMFIMLVGVSFTRPLLTLMSVPSDLIDQSCEYLRIYFLGMPFFMLYNFSASIFRSWGDTTRPLICLTSAGAINVVLNVVFVVVFNMGVAGVAVATVISNAISATALLCLLIKRDGPLRFNIRKPEFDKSVLADILKIGLPSGFLGSVFSISNVCVQSAINTLDTAAISASTAASNIEIYIQFFGNAFAQTTTTYISQNYGAKNYDRCKKVLKTALIACISISTFLSAVVMLLSHQLLGLFVSDAAVIEIAISRMKYTVVFKFVQAVMDIMVGTLQGYGYTLVPAFISIFGVCGVRLLWIFTVFPTFNTLASIMFIYPVTQAIASLLLCCCYIFVIRRRMINSDTVSLENT